MEEELFPRREDFSEETVLMFIVLDRLRSFADMGDE